ncbi:DUF2897 family protein [Shewanella marinintestina]|uniref:DUF2897 family protein n=1 Tax=Shewanella marinintestina TaxID=190305 RepID=UPI0020105ABF|nr:DUF2897 family protein [Shewanella marinintestina]MCL1144594.1 DUF2897 family protein [Shewanella marinintestina]
MSDLEVGLLILLVVGIIASNLAVLKYSAKFKMTQFGKKDQKGESSTDDTKENDNTSDDKQA